MPVSLSNYLPPHVLSVQTQPERQDPEPKETNSNHRHHDENADAEQQGIPSNELVVSAAAEQLTTKAAQEPAASSVVYAQVLAGRGDPGDRSGNPKEAMFSFPFGIAQHPNGSLYVADTENAGIKMLAANYAVVVTVASSSHGLKTPVDVVVCPKTGNVYVSDAGHYVIHRLSPNGSLNMISGDGVTGYRESDGRESARWDFPWAMAFDLDGELLVCDTANHVVRKIYVSEFENGVGQAANAIYPRTERVAGLDGLNGNRDGDLDSALLDAPTAIAVSPDGNIFIADSGCGHIRKIFPDRSQMITVPGVYAGAMGLACDAYGRLYISNTEQGSILVYDDRDGRVNQLNVEGLKKPHGIVVDSGSGILFVVDSHTIRSVPIERALPPSESHFPADLSCLVAGGSAHDNLKDITFWVDGESFKAHKCIILARCPQLYQAIQDVSEHRMQDISFAALVAFMNFLYTDNCTIEPHTWDHLLIISEVYELDRLRELVEDYAVRRICVDNVLQTLRLSHQCRATRLKRACMKTVLRNFQQLQNQIPVQGLSDCPEILTELLLSIPK